MLSIPLSLLTDKLSLSMYSKDALQDFTLHKKIILKGQFFMSPVSVGLSEL